MAISLPPLPGLMTPQARIDPVEFRRLYQPFYWASKVGVEQNHLVRVILHAILHIVFASKVVLPHFV